MGEHSTWFDFLNALPGWRDLQHVLEHQLGRGEGAANPWKFAMFDQTHFTLAHVLGLLVVALFLIFGAIAYRRGVTGGVQKAIVPPPKFNVRNLFEMFTDAVLSIAEGVMGKKSAAKYLPLIGSLALVIFFCNSLALIPGFTPPTDTLKTNLALAVVVFLATHYFGVKEHGLAYFKHFMGPIWWLAPLMLPIELISHIARPASLSLRLMGNMASDHKVVAAFFTLVPLLVPVPFLVLGLLVVVVQTLVFCLLSMVYISMAVAHEDHH
ncbi:MAG: F0F1 ATP synthase subunit A [Deltaproteobacteria bacterium]|nr:F0F1 ATP synthase subunit A [Deltaproteobacteria bacterium]